MDFRPEDKEARDRAFNSFLKSLPKLSASDADQVLYSYYETTYGVFNHRDKALLKKRPLATVALHDAEENTTTSALYESIDLFVKNDIGKHTGLNMVEFFALPREIFNKVLLSCGERAAKESQEAAAFNKRTESAFSDKGLPAKP